MNSAKCSQEKFIEARNTFWQKWIPKKFVGASVTIIHTVSRRKLELDFQKLNQGKEIIT